VDNHLQPRPVVLCADDYAIAPGVSLAILELINGGRLSATSCMTVSPFWPEHAAWLRSHTGAADIGLHLTLTDLAPLGPMPRLAPEGRLPPLPRLLALALARRLDRDEVAHEVDRQIERFIAAFGGPPDFIDGHLHVHQLPIVREIVVDRLCRALPPGTYVRVCDEPTSDILRRRIAVPRALVISRLGRALRRRVRQLGIPANLRFAGVRDFDEADPYRSLFLRFIQDAPDCLLVMCHPGMADRELAAADRVTTQREEEYRYFLGQEFLADLTRANVVLARFNAADARRTSSASH
jgi:chitin disaccharide deacetylase